MNSQNKIFCACIAVAMLVFAGCGGSSGNGGNGDVNPPPPPTGGITRTGVAFAVGPITGFGSVIVNGNTYDTSSATFTKDGQAATQADFAVGHMVVIQGTIDDDDTNAAATSVEFDENVEGPVSNVDSVASMLVVLGQTVNITASTSVDDSCPATLADFLTVAAVEVSGPVKTDGSIEATRIECKNIVGELEVLGVVSALDTGAMTFMINALVVDYSSAMLQNFPGGIISNGDPVEAKDSDGGGLGGDGELVATRVEFKGAQFGENEGDHIEIEGFITRFASATDFDVAEIPVTTIAGTTVFEGGTSTDLGPNLKIEAEGEFDDMGVLNATKIEIKDSTAVRVTGLVDSVSGDTLQILGINITTDSVKTRFEDKQLDVDPFRIADLNAGDYVEVRGQEMPVGEVFAFLLERDDPDTRTELRGFVEAGGVTRPNLTVLGVTIETNGATVFKDDSEVVFANPDDFWTAVAEGSLIDVQGTETGAQTLLAEEVELESE
jgi:hypothetical protein